MKYNKLGSSGLSVSEICLGTMTWGEQNSETEAHQQLDYAVSPGINFVDVAEMYPVPPKAERFTTRGRSARRRRSKSNWRPSPVSSKPERSVILVYPMNLHGEFWSSFALPERKDCRWWRRSRTPIACSTGVLKWAFRKSRVGRASRCWPTVRSALAIAFVRSRWFCASTIIGATTMDQLLTCAPNSA